MDPRIIKTFEYQGTHLGELVDYGTSREFVPKLGEFEAIDLVQEMPARDKIHMRHTAYAVFRLLEHYAITPEDYIDDEDIAIHVADLGVHNLTDLNHKDYRAWELVQQRGLSDKLFSKQEPSDLEVELQQ